MKPHAPRSTPHAPRTKELAMMEKCQNKPNLLIVSVVLIIGML